MSAIPIDNNTNTFDPSMLLTFTLHLPGLNKTVQFPYLPQVVYFPKEQDKPNVMSMKEYTKFTESVCDTYNIVHRRANFYKISNGDCSELYNSKISDGDTLILVVRSTFDASQNEYYNNQQDSLKNNKYLQPSITKYQAASLLADIWNHNFELFGLRHWLPGGTGYECQQYFLKNLTNYD